MRIDAAPPLQSVPLLTSTSLQAQSDTPTTPFEVLVAGGQAATDKHAYSFSKLGWAGHSAASTAAPTGGALLASTRPPIKGAYPSMSSQVGQAQSASSTLSPPLAASQALATGFGTATPNVAADAALGSIAVSTAAAPGPPPLVTANAPVSQLALETLSQVQSTGGAQPSAIVEFTSDASPLVDAPTPLSPLAGQTTPTTANSREAFQATPDPAAAESESSSPVVTPSLSTTTTTNGASSGDISVIVISQGGVAQVVASAPGLSPVAAARLRRAVEGVAAEFRVAVSNLCLNGASQPRAPISLIGDWNVG